MQIQNTEVSNGCQWHMLVVFRLAYYRKRDIKHMLWQDKITIKSRSEGNNVAGHADKMTSDECETSLASQLASLAHAFNTNMTSKRQDTIATWMEYEYTATNGDRSSSIHLCDAFINQKTCALILAEIHSGANTFSLSLSPSHTHTKTIAACLRYSIVFIAVPNMVL